MNIPVKVEGAAPGVLISGGVLSLNKRKLRVKALPKNLPDSIVINISALELGNKLYTAELQKENYKILHPDNTVVCQVRTSRAAILVEDQETSTDAETSTEEGAEPSADKPSES
tara:strand:- start:160 stop:501 length:342 start_codon:yes stop_codon:yes gene_type:complete